MNNENKTNINWYPGHMAKTKREITNIKPNLERGLIFYNVTVPSTYKVYVDNKLIEEATTKEKYKNFMYLELMPEDKNNVPFYEKHGFHVMENGAAMQICNIN